MRIKTDKKALDWVFGFVEDKMKKGELTYYHNPIKKKKKKIHPQQFEAAKNQFCVFLFDGKNQHLISASFQSGKTGEIFCFWLIFALYCEKIELSMMVRPILSNHTSSNSLFTKSEEDCEGFYALVVEELRQKYGVLTNLKQPLVFKRGKNKKVGEKAIKRVLVHTDMLFGFGIEYYSDRSTDWYDEYLLWADDEEDIAQGEKEEEAKYSGADFLVSIDRNTGERKALFGTNLVAYRNRLHYTGISATPFATELSKEYNSNLEVIEMPPGPGYVGFEDYLKEYQQTGVQQATNVLNGRVIDVVYLYDTHHRSNKTEDESKTELKLNALGNFVLACIEKCYLPNKSKFDNDEYRPVIAFRSFSYDNMKDVEIAFNNLCKDNLEFYRKLKKAGFDGLNVECYSSRDNKSEYSDLVEKGIYRVENIGDTKKIEVALFLQGLGRGDDVTKDHLIGYVGHVCGEVVNGVKVEPYDPLDKKPAQVLQADARICGYPSENEDFVKALDMEVVEAYVKYKRKESRLRHTYVAKKALVDNTKSTSSVIDWYVAILNKQQLIELKEKLGVDKHRSAAYTKSRNEASVQEILKGLKNGLAVGQFGANKGAVVLNGWNDEKHSQDTVNQYKQLISHIKTLGNNYNLAFKNTCLYRHENSAKKEDKLLCAIESRAISHLPNNIERKRISSGSRASKKFGINDVYVDGSIFKRLQNQQ